MTANTIKLPSGSVLAIDEKGYLLDWQAWTPEVAETMAATDGMELNADHRAVLKIFRDYFEQFEIEPPMRALVKICRERLGDEKSSSVFLYRLFPDGPTLQASRYSGLPRPLSCI